MTDTPFIVENGLIANGSFTANSTQFGITGSVTANTTTVVIGTATVNSSVYTGTSNNTAYVGSISAANVVSNAQLSANLSNYQTTAGLSANVATLTSNNTNYFNGVPSSGYVTNTHVGSSGNAHAVANTTVAGFISSIDQAFINSLKTREFDATAYGVVAGLSIDNTSYVQAAIDAAVAAGGGTVVLPAGYVKITSTITISGNYVGIKGQGIGSTILYVTSADTDGILIGDPSNGVRFSNFLQDMTIYSGATDPTAGALVHTQRTSMFRMQNVVIQNGFIDYWAESAVHTIISHCRFLIDGNMSAYTAGSSCIRIGTYSGGVVSATFYFVDIEANGSTLNHYAESSIRIDEVDTMFILGYIGWTRYGLYIKPATTTSVIWSINTYGLYIDNCSYYGLYVAEPASYNGSIGFCEFDIGTIHACQYGIVWNCGSSYSNTIKGANIQNIGVTGVELTKANYLKLFGITCEAVNQGNTTGGGVTVRAACANIDIFNLVVRKTFGSYGPYRGLYLEAGSSDVHARSMTFHECQNDVVYASTAANNMIEGWKSDNVFPTVASAASVTFPVHDSFLISGNTTISSISGAAWEGRRVIFRTSNAVSFVASTTIGANLKTSIGVPVIGIYLNSKWYFK